MLRMCYFVGIILLFLLGMLLRDGLETWAGQWGPQWGAQWEMAKSAFHLSDANSASASRSSFAPANQTLEKRSEHAETPWRRTKNGWEDASKWIDPTRQSHPHVSDAVGSLHPLIIATLQVLISVGALLWFSPKERPNSPVG